MMEFATLNENNNLSNQFKENLDSYHNQFNSLLEDYKKNYVLYNSMPTNNEYASIFFSDKSGLQGLNNKLSKTTIDIQKNIVAISTQVGELNKAIAVEKTKEGDLNKRLAIYTGQNNTSETLIGDYKQLYFNNYVSNITLGLGIIIGGGLLSTFRKSAQNQLK